MGRGRRPCLAGVAESKVASHRRSRVAFMIGMDVVSRNAEGADRGSKIDSMARWIRFPSPAQPAAALVTADVEHGPAGGLVELADSVHTVVCRPTTGSAPRPAPHPATHASTAAGSCGLSSSTGPPPPLYHAGR